MFFRAMLRLHREERARAIHDHGNSADAILAAVLEAEAVTARWDLRKAELLAELDRQGITDRRRGLKTRGTSRTEKPASMDVSVVALVS